MIKSLSTSLALAGISGSLVFMSQISPASAITLIGNLPQTNDLVRSQIARVGSEVSVKALGFTLPTGSDYTLTNVILRLEDYNPGEQPIVQIRNDVGGLNPGNTVLASFINPASQGSGIFDYTFTPTSAFTFLANTKYWLYVSNNFGDFDFRGSFPAQTMTGIATLAGNRYSTNSGVSFVNSNVLNSFQINVTEAVTPVPEPTTIAGIMVGYGFMRWKKTSGKSKKAKASA
ncbi:PEP-CTERM putative exosortase interaction domain-containing protein [Nostoc sp. PCC 7524]|uniref:choice-of-anchor R domain-containing protein n=1 Tax=Nostoc sp. (strain ATCC 29411 / PCC 7524) TaxID=28072 RepID=UPI00029F2035|nr:choice-of-anchor R domain-containing protein [Nostoc sp. PCC 7524]AFY46213.1 PEP-CTERM putative exosortase interaction domain-containing protein [Nostoc sp. PCC 7524]